MYSKIKYHTTSCTNLFHYINKYNSGINKSKIMYMCILFFLRLSQYLVPIVHVAEYDLKLAVIYYGRIRTVYECS